MHHGRKDLLRRGEHMKTKAAFLLFTTASLFAGPITTADAVKPSAGCPPPFEGPLTFEQLIERWPPPPELPDPDAVLSGFDRNGDKLLCVQEAPTQGNPPAPINVIDNTART
jgi:hypothetical protein